MQVTSAWQHVGHLGTFAHQPLNTLMVQITQTYTDRVPWVSSLVLSGNRRHWFGCQCRSWWGDRRLWLINTISLKPLSHDGLIVLEAEVAVFHIADLVRGLRNDRVPWANNVFCGPCGKASSRWRTQINSLFFGLQWQTSIKNKS